MFRMLGNKVELIRYIIRYIENDEEFEERCISEEHKNIVEQKLIQNNIVFSTEEINQLDNEWFNCLEFENYDKALEVFNCGEQVYLQNKLKDELVDNLKLRSDIDYLAIMSGVEI